jgi:hypothetical protein
MTGNPLLRHYIYKYHVSLRDGDTKMEEIITVKSDSHGYGRSCVSCSDEEVEMECCRLSSLAGDNKERVQEKDEATYIVKHDVMGCKGKKGKPVLYRGLGIDFQPVDGDDTGSSCTGAGMEEGTPSCSTGSCGFSTKGSIRDQMGDFTSTGRHHVKCGIPALDKDGARKEGKYSRELDCCTKVTAGTKHPVLACKLDKLASSDRILVTGRWDMTDEESCKGLGEALGHGMKQVPSGLKKRVVPRVERFKYIKDYNIAGNIIEAISRARKDIKHRIKNPPYYIPLENVHAMEVIHEKSGNESKCKWSLKEAVNRHSD